MSLHIQLLQVDGSLNTVAAVTKAFRDGAVALVKGAVRTVGKGEFCQI